MDLPASYPAGSSSTLSSLATGEAASPAASPVVFTTTFDGFVSAARDGSLGGELSAGRSRLAGASRRLG
jgi:hypothetical protein